MTEYSAKSKNWKMKWNATPIFTELNSDKVNDEVFPLVKNLHFKLNPNLFYFGNCFLDAFGFHSDDFDKYTGLQAIRKGKVIVNSELMNLLDCFNGENNVNSIYKFSLGKSLDLRLIKGADDSQYCARIDSFAFFWRIVKLLWSESVLLLEAMKVRENIEPYSESSTDQLLQNSKRLVDEGEGLLDSTPVKIKEEFKDPLISSVMGSKELDVLGKERVLLLGDTQGTASVGLLYLSSYLKRNGVDVRCILNNFSNSQSLQKDLERVLLQTQPTIIGISLKWFLHIARVLAIAEYIKSFDDNIKVVLGGNTATYYWDEIIQNEFVDYIVLGDGEEPFLKLCIGESNVPNLVYKRGNDCFSTDVCYVQNEENSSDIFLTDLEDLFVTKKDPFLAEYLYLPVGKGCNMSCFYCAGCNEVQKLTFNRSKAFLRDTDSIRKDISILKKYTSTLMFDFEIPAKEDVEFYQNIWHGIDLSKHFSIFFFWSVPSEELILLISKTFRCCHLYIDLATFDEKKRLKLTQNGWLKDQPKDSEIFQFCDQCEGLDNISFGICSIWGTPFFSAKEVYITEEIVANLYRKYRSFLGVECMKLHAQPGAPILNQLEQFGLYSDANNFQEFYHYSQLNYKCDKEHVEVYPYIKFLDPKLKNQVDISLQTISYEIYNSFEKSKYLEIEINLEDDEIDYLYRNGIIKGRTNNIMVNNSSQKTLNNYPNSMCDGDDLFYRFIKRKLDKMECCF
ncbi:MAG: radical SAM protein [Marinifilaceae bacterium]